MLLKAKLAAPRPDYPSFGQPVLSQIFDSPASLFVAPEGYLLTDSLASILSEHNLPVGWLRLGHEDCDPGTLLLSLVSGVQRLYPGIGIATFNRMRGQPGPIAGWEPHYTQLALELSAALANNFVMVIENVENLAYSPASLLALGNYFLPRLRKDVHCILISQQSLPRASLPAHTRLYDAKDLRLDENAGLRLMQRSGAELTSAGIQRSIDLAGGRVSALTSLLQASALLGPTWVDREVMRAPSMDELLTRIGRASLEGAEEGAIQSLALSMRLEYSHPAMMPRDHPVGPWLQPLSDGWEHMRRWWTRPLHKALKDRALPYASTVHQAAGFLAGQNAFYQAVNFYFETRDTASAARIIAPLADGMMDMGQWATLNAWLKRLPPQDLQEWPWLVYMGGKIAAAQGHVETARKSFAAATGLFTHRQESNGICLSLLAESALASWRGDLTLAKERALNAFALAQRSGLGWYQGWAAWQLGSLAANAGELDEASQWFNPDAALPGQVVSSPLGEMLRLAGELIQRRQELLRQREIHQKAFLESQRAEKEITSRLQNLLTSPPENLDTLLETHGWAHIPLMPISSAFIQAMPGEKDGLSPLKLLEALFTALKLPLAGSAQPRGEPSSRPTFDNTGQPDLAEPPILPAESQPAPTSPEGAPGREAGQDVAVEPSAAHLAPSGEAVAAGPHPPAPITPATPGRETRAGREEEQPPSPAAAQLPIFPSLRVCLLGQFSVEMNGQPLADWPNTRGRSIFKYLVMHHDQFTPREVLMDTFWPDAAPEPARNNLNVALHNLRGMLNSTAAHPVVRFHNGAYQLDPRLGIWVDGNEFEIHVQEGRRLETAGDPAAALREYEAAVALYKGDFLSDDLYEEWPVLIRERLRVTYLETLDRLSQAYFKQAEYNACIALCQSILGIDACREDAHCRLMRCYSRLGLDHLALRQYQVCSEALKAELDVSPAPATTTLYQKIRRHEPI